MGTINIQEQIKALNIDGLKAVEAAHALIDEHPLVEGKAREADVQAQIDKLLARQVETRKEVERLMTLKEQGEFYNKVDTQNLLPVQDKARADGPDEFTVTREMKLFNSYRAGELTKEQWAKYRDSSSDQAAAFKAALLGNTDPRVLKHLPKAEESKGPGYDIIGDHLSPELKVALNEGTTTQGGYLVPVIYAQEIIVPLANESWMRQTPRIRTINIQTDNFRLPRMAYSTAAVLTTETTAYDEKEPTFTEQAFTPYKYTREVKVSEELLEDSRFNVWGEIIQPDIVQAFAEAENAAFAQGTGTSQPEGVTINAPVGVTEATGHTLTLAGADDIIKLYYSLDFKYRNNATWQMADALAGQIRQMKDSQNRYLWADNINNLLGPQQPLLLGRPVQINTGMPAAAANAITIVFGDFAYFVITDRAGLVIIFADQLRRATGQVSWFIRKRFDSHMMNTAAFTALKMSAT